MKIHLWLNCLQRTLFPQIEAQLGPLSSKEQEFVRIVEFCDLDKLIVQYQWAGVGRKPASRLSLAKAFVAKMVWNLSTTEALISMLESSPSLRRLCGWEMVKDIPDRSTFSRAFDQFAQGQLPQMAHNKLITEHLGDHLVGHVSIDATAIEGREAPVKNIEEPSPKSPPRKKGRPKKDQEREPAPPKRLELQPSRSYEQNLADLPTECNVGTKRNSSGFKESWIGFKFHIASTDFDVPICAILTSASLHDSQVAIPLMQRRSELVKNSLYDLMDAAYDAPAIDAFSRAQGHVPIIDPNPRSSKTPRLLAPHEKSRFKERSSVERVNSNLKDNWGGRFVRVRGAAKVACHLFFGILAMTADRLMTLLP